MSIFGTGGSRPRLFVHYAIYIAILGLTILVTTLINSRVLRETAYQVTRSDLHALATLARNLMPPEAMVDSEAAQAFCERSALDTGTRITIIRRDGTVLGDSAADPATMENHADRPEFRAAMDGEEGISVRYSDTLEKMLMYAALPVLLDGEIGVVLRASLTVANIEALLAELYRRVAVATAALLFVALLFTILISRSLRRPIRNLHEAALAYSRGELDYQLPVTGPRELQDLAVGFQTMARELEERLRHLQGQRQETEELLNTIREPLLLLDGELRIQRLNMAAAQLVASASAELIGKPLIELFRSAELDAFARKVAEGEEPRESAIVYYGPREMRLKVWGVRLSAKGSMLEGDILILIRDVSQEHRVDQIRKDFVANVSHELKTPLTMIKGAIETLQELPGSEDETRSRFEGMIESHTDRMIAIIEDLLSLARIEQSEATDLPRQEVELQTLLREAASAVEAVARERSTTINIEAPEELTGRVHSPLLIQALTNLIDNAVKYGDPGGTVTLRAAKEDEEGFRLEVEDQGWGIPLREQDRVFERFYRVDRSRSRERGGTGLGLAIVRHVALIHGGRVSLVSAPGEGSTFALHIPGGRK